MFKCKCFWSPPNGCHTEESSGDNGGNVVSPIIIDTSDLNTLESETPSKEAIERLNSNLTTPIFLKYHKSETQVYIGCVCGFIHYPSINTYRVIFEYFYKDAVKTIVVDIDIDRGYTVYTPNV